MTTGFHGEYLALVDHIEREFPVAEWRYGDVDLWPLARMDLYLDLYWQNNGSRPGISRRRHFGPAMKALFEARRRPGKPVDAVFLGNGTSFELIDEKWQDRYCDPLVAAIEDCGRTCFLMEDGDAHRRQPQLRQIHSTRLIDIAGHLLAPFAVAAANLPAHDAVVEMISRAGMVTPSLSAERLKRRGRIVSSTASVFQTALRKLKPSLAFVVAWYAGLRPAFVQACRRQQIMSVDLQHCPQGRGHKAYHWAALPERGYSTMPAVFWNWTQADAAAIDKWTGHQPWHRSFHGGVPVSDYTASLGLQIAALVRAEKEILVALQTLDGHQHTWSELADEIERSPSGWRWWIRRHPAATAEQSRQYGRLLHLSRPNVIVGPKTELPLPLLLKHMDAVVSLSSGAAVEGAAMGVPALFLARDADARFPEVFASRNAVIVEEVSCLNHLLAGLRKAAMRDHIARPHDLSERISSLMNMAANYRRLFRSPPSRSLPCP